MKYSPIQVRLDIAEEWWVEVSWHSDNISPNVCTLASFIWVLASYAWVLSECSPPKIHWSHRFATFTPVLYAGLIPTFSSMQYSLSAIAGCAQIFAGLSSIPTFLKGKEACFTFYIFPMYRNPLNIILGMKCWSEQVLCQEVLQFWIERVVWIELATQRHLFTSFRGGMYVMAPWFSWLPYVQLTE